MRCKTDGRNVLRICKDKNTKQKEEEIHLERDTILFSEFDAALSDKNGKAEGKDGIQAELLNVLGAKGKRNYMISAMKYMLVGNDQTTFCTQ